MATEKQIDKALENLHKAVAKYVELSGGKVLVTGGVQVIKFPGDLQYNWTLGVRCTGRPPVVAQSNTASTPTAGTSRQNSKSKSSASSVKQAGSPSGG